MNEKRYSTISEIKEDIDRALCTKQRKSTSYTIPENITKKAKNALVDLEENHDNSFAVEMFLNNIKRLNNINAIYRGREINGYEFWNRVYKYAKALKAMKISKGDVIPVMMSNCPEYFFLMVAIDLIGAIMNIVGPWFDKDYLKEIFIESKSKYIFVTDDINESIIYGINNADNVQEVFMFSLTDSLARDEKGFIKNPYFEYDDRFGHFKNNIQEYKNAIGKDLLSSKDFLLKAKEYNGTVVEDMVLSDPCIITYTSGTTSKGRPKACLHSNRNYLSIARFKKSDVAPMPPLKKVIALAHLPSYTQTVLTAAYLDPLYMGWTTALEPYYDLDFYPYSLLINKPNYTVETPEYEKYVAKLLDTAWKTVKMEYRIAICVAGQELSQGLERYLNRISKEHKFGTARLPFPFAPVTISIAGGTTENGGFLSTLFKALQEKRPSHLLHKEPMLLQSIGLADIEVLSENGRRCRNYERGMCVVNSPTNQIGYVDEKYNTDIDIIDEHGKTWRTMATPGYKDRFGCLRLVDRPNTDIVTSEGKIVPLYTVLDLVKVDIKNIMEAYLVKIPDKSHEKYVIHIEKQPDSQMDDYSVIKMSANRLKDKVDSEILSNLYFRIRSFTEGFPVAGTGKTDMDELQKEGITKNTISFSDASSH